MSQEEDKKTTTTDKLMSVQRDKPVLEGKEIL